MVCKLGEGFLIVLLGLLYLEYITAIKFLLKNKKNLPDMLHSNDIQFTKGKQIL